MHFPSDTETYKILQWVQSQINATRNAVRFGWDISITPTKKQRSGAQNRFLMAVLQHIVQFHVETGFCPSGCAPWAMRTDVQKEYWKSVFGITATSKLSTTEFGNFIDKIQGTMAAESHGEYEILTPPDEYAELINH